MDNEEIRKLLQELKKTSDESTAVRSKVVKIHFDTPEEAERRRRIKRRAEEEEARKQLEEQARAEAEEEERRREAEKAAMEAVEEAKLEAKAGFSSDLEQDLQSAMELEEEEEAGENADDLDLNWEYEEPRLSTDGPEEEEDDGFTDEDEEEFREPDDTTMTEEDPIRSLFGSIAGGLASLADRFRERGAEERGAGEDDEEPQETSSEDAAEAEPQKTSSGDAAEAEPQKTGSASGTRKTGKAGRPRKARFGRRTVPADQAEGSTEEGTAVGGTTAGENAAGGINPEGTDADGLSAGAQKTTDPDEEWKIRMEQPPRRSLRRRRIPDKPVIALEKPQPEAENTLDEPEAPARETAAAAGMPEETVPDTDGLSPVVTLSNEEFPNQGETAEEEPSEPKSIAVVDLDENTNSKGVEVIPLDARSTGPLPILKGGHLLGKKTADAEAGKGPAAGAAGKPKASGKPKISGKQLSAFFRERLGPLLHNIGVFIGGHRKQCIAGAVAAAVILALIVLAAAVLPKMKNTRHATIREDEGLTLQVLDQPGAFTTEGDVAMRAKAPETIQSITVNSRNVPIEQGRTVDFTYHATGGTLDVMVVSTDKVRSATVTLAYVDSAPPVITLSEKDGLIEISAEDTESGLKALYVGTCDGLSDVPQYEEYKEPFEADPNVTVSYYAVDEAGNSSVPVVTALTPAESIAFREDRIGLYPGNSMQVEMVTTPENAFISGLTLEVENSKVAQISGSTLTAVAEGDTKITASAEGLAPVTATVSVAQSRTVTISAVGDCTLGTDVNLSQNTSFDAYQAMYGNTYFFEKVRNILNADDSTFANFEGTLTESTLRAEKTFAFRGDPSYTEILKDGSIDVVTLANNHTSDYGATSLTDTQEALDAAGIEWCEGDNIAWQELNGVRTAFIGIYALDNGVTKLEQTERTIREAREQGADLVIVEFHWGNELVTTVDQYQKQLAHAAVDAGADLVLGSHAHVLLGIEKYNGVHIVYGLGNFCFGGNANPHSDESMIWQQTFTFTAEGLQSEDDISIIPVRISSDTTINNYQPVPVTGEEAESIMKSLDELCAEFGGTYSQYMTDGTKFTA